MGSQAGVCGGVRLVAAGGGGGQAEVVDREQELAPGTWRVQTAGHMGVWSHDGYLHVLRVCCVVRSQSLCTWLW